MKYLYFTALICFFTISAAAQEINATVTKSGMFTDEYKLSGIVAVAEDSKDGVTIARWYKSYFGKTHGYIFEHFNGKLAKTKSFDHKMKKGHLVDVLINKDVLSMIEFIYDKDQKAYICYANSANVKDFKFTKKELFRMAMKKQKASIFRTYPDASDSDDDKRATIKYNDDKSAFAIFVNVNTGKKENEAHKVFAFNKNFEPLCEAVIKETFEKDEYAIESMDVSADGTVYMLARVEEKKNKKDGPDYSYELVTITKGGTSRTTFDTNEHYAAFLKVAAVKEGVVCVGFYSDRGDSYKKGACHFSIDASGKVKTSRFSPFDESFMKRYVKKPKKELDDFRFSNLAITSSGEAILIGEEFKTTTTMTGVGTDMRTDTSYSYKDIITVKLNANGEIVWVKAIDKGQFTRGAASKYFSYSVMMLNNDLYYFINGNMELSDVGLPYISYKGLEDTDMNVVKIASDGTVKAKKLLDKSEIKVPFMVSEGGMLPQSREAYFLGREGKKKQLVKIKF